MSEPQHCELCDGTRADCTPCPGLVCEVQESHAKQAARLRRVTPRVPYIPAELLQECTGCAEKDAEIARLRALVEEVQREGGVCLHGDPG